MKSYSLELQNKLKINESYELSISFWSELDGYSLRFVSLSSESTQLIEIYSKNNEVLGVYFTLK